MFYNYSVIEMVWLKPGRERSVELRHPWLFSGAIERISGQPRAGEAVDVCDHHGRWLARGTWSDSTQLPVRLWSWEPDEAIDAALIGRRLTRAIAARSELLHGAETSTYRLVFSEADQLPGLIVDRYGDYLVLQLSTAGAAVRAPSIVEALRERLPIRGIIERVDAEMHAKEGLGGDRGRHWGELPNGPIEVVEHGLSFLVDLNAGQKTGAYLDQRINRQRVAHYARGQAILGAFCYTGGFELAAARAGASVITAIDSSAEALRLAAANQERNRLPTPIEWVEGNVFSELRRLRAEERRFDLVILDPPKFVQQRHQLERGARGYKDINLLALQLLRPGGLLATFSCSGLVSSDLFQKIVFGAAIDARREVQIIERLTQAADHPILLSFPESDYLKGLLCRVW